METLAADLATMVRTPLTDEHVAAMRRVGTVIDVKAGDWLQEAGARIDTFHYMLSGETEAVNATTGERYGDGTLGQGQFFGELAFLSGGRALFERASGARYPTALCAPRGYA